MYIYRKHLLDSGIVQVMLILAIFFCLFMCQYFNDLIIYFFYLFFKRTSNIQNAQASIQDSFFFIYLLGARLLSSTLNKIMYKWNSPLSTAEETNIVYLSIKISKYFCISFMS